MTESSQPITLSDKAAEKIKELLAGQETATSRPSASPSAAAVLNFQYALAFDAPKEDDHRFEHQGVAVVVDKTSMQFVFGSEVDWVDGLQGADFSANNPNVVAACGWAPRSRSARTRPRKRPPSEPSPRLQSRGSRSRSEGLVTWR